MQVKFTEKLSELVHVRTLREAKAAYTSVSKRLDAKV